VSYIVVTSADLKRSIVLAGRKTSISMEEPFWQALKEIARKQNRKLADLIVSIDSERTLANRSSALRLFVLDHYQRRSASEPARENRAAAH
jgi:predicted DNA-binding ribbon-helix-helix protein